MNRNLLLWAFSAFLSFRAEGQAFINTYETVEFGILGPQILPSAFQLRIYGRWGELDFETRDLQFLGINGKAAPAGVYLYQLEMQTCDGLVKPPDLLL